MDIPGKMSGEGMVKGSKSKNDQMFQNRGRPFLVIGLVLSVIGIGVSIKLTQIHYFTHTDPSYESVCAVSEAVNCETVAQSPYAVFLGTPISVWGIFGYFFMAFFALWGLSRKRLHATWPQGILFGLFFMSLISSSLLAYVSFTRIDSLCIFCMSLYIINGLLFAVSAAGAFVARKNPIWLVTSDLKALFSKPLLLIALFVAAGGIVAALVGAMPKYWHHPGWDDLPKLPTGQDEKGCHWMGAKNPVITVVEFSDYECPHCRVAHKKMRMSAAQYPDKVRLIHNHLPLDQACNEDIQHPFHNRACEFSKAAECAAEQDKFWEMNDAIFSIQETVRSRDVNIERIAVQLGLDRSAFKECMAREGIPECIKDDMEKARRLQVAGTPTFFVGNQPYPGGLPDGLLEVLLSNEDENQQQYRDHSH